MHHAAPTKVAIIGCGYVGSALGRALVGVGADVVGTTTSPDRAAELSTMGITPVVAEHSEIARLRQALLDRAVLFVTVAPKSDDQTYRAVYPTGVRNVLAAVEGTAVGRLVYTSSTRVYGQDDGSWVDEGSATEPADEKGRFLLEAERLFLDGARAAGRVATVVRLAGIYGPGRDGTARIRTAAGTQREDGDPYVNLVHLHDVVAVLSALVDSPYEGVLNVADDHPESRRAYYDRVLAAAGLPPIRWVRTEGTPSLGKRVRNKTVKRTLKLSLIHPDHA